MAQKIEAKTERPLQTHYVKQFLAVNTVASRVSEPNDGCFYDLTNCQPIGYANLHSIDDALRLHDFGSDRVYADFNANLQGQETLLIATTNGKLFAYAVGLTLADGTPDVWQIGEGLSGTDALDIVQYDDQHALIIDSTGYYRYSEVYVRVHSRPTGWVPEWIVPISTPSTPSQYGAPTSGQAIAVYNNMVWIAQNRTLYYSKIGISSDTPPGFEDFQVDVNGGGWDIIDDSTLRGSIKALFAANGYLYLFGSTSVDAISDVYTTASTDTAGIAHTVTNFTRLNISAIIGTDDVETIMAYGRLVMFANQMGVWVLLGTWIQLMSTDVANSYMSGIDGTWQYLDWNHFNDTVQWINRAGDWVDWENNNQKTVLWQLDNYTPFPFHISGGQVRSNNLLCAAFCVVRKNDPIMGSGLFLCMYYGDASGQSYKWWFADWTQDLGPVTHVCTSFANGAPALFGYIGNVLYQLFADKTSSPSARIITPLWDFNDPLADKQALRAGIRLSMQAKQEPAVSVNIDTLTSSHPIKLGDIGTVDWLSNTEQLVDWGVKWQNLRNFMLYFGKAPESFSKCLGFTVRTVRGTQFEMNMFALDYKVGARWIGD